jgi:hypothetical protein
MTIFQPGAFVTRIPGKGWSGQVLEVRADNPNLLIVWWMKPANVRPNPREECAEFLVPDRRGRDRA